MNADPVVVRRQVEITNALGLHFRPAEKFVNTAHRFQAEIVVWYQGQSRDGRSLLDLATLAAERGAQLELEATGPDAADAVAALADLVAADFFEDELGQEKPPASSPNGPVSAPTAEADPNPQSTEAPSPAADEGVLMNTVPEASPPRDSSPDHG